MTPNPETNLVTLLAKVFVGMKKKRVIEISGKKPETISDKDSADLMVRFHKIPNNSNNKAPR
jgi:hypothetical protein